MDALQNLSATLLSTGKSTCQKSITLFISALLLAMLATSVAAQAQANNQSAANAGSSMPTLVVTALDAGRFYGDPNPALTGTITGLKSGDTITATYSTVADPNSPVGAYLIIPTVVDPDNQLSNYVVIINNGTLTVTPAPLSIVADDLTRTAGQPNPAFTGTIAGVKNGEAITATYDSPATVASPAGAYSIVPTLNDSSGKIGNYAVSISNGTLTITP